MSKFVLVEQVWNAAAALAVIAACRPEYVIAVPLLLLPLDVQPPCVWMPTTWLVELLVSPTPSCLRPPGQTLCGWAWSTVGAET